MAATAAVTGSITVCHALIPSGLVDEYGLFVYPVVLSRTRRLLSDGSKVASLNLVSPTPFQSGVVLLTDGVTRETPHCPNEGSSCGTGLPDGFRSWTCCGSFTSTGGWSRAADSAATHRPERAHRTPLHRGCRRRTKRTTGGAAGAHRSRQIDGSAVGVAPEREFGCWSPPASGLGHRTPARTCQREAPATKVATM